MSNDDENKGPALGARHLQTFLLFVAVTIHYCVRQNISISLVAMTNAETTNPDFHEFNWTEKQKSYIMSSFFWGYIITQIPGGLMARKLGVKTTLFIATLGSSLFNLLIPLGSYNGSWQAYSAIRVIQGLFQGLVFPSVNAHLAIWSPAEERTRLGSVSHIGTETGTILAMGLTGFIAASDLGWPGISYVNGGIGLVFCVVWIIFAENSPAEARFINSEEREYILLSQARANGKTKTSIPIPWKSILTSAPFISLLVVRICQNWGSSTMHTQIPAYLRGVLGMDMKSNAFFSSLPYVSMWFLSFVFLFATEIALKNNWASLGVVRKTMNTIAMWVPAALLIAIGFLDKNQKALAMTLLILNVGLNGGQVIGSLLNLIDLSPNHAGILTSIINLISNIIPIITPLVVGVIVTEQTERNLWQIVFIIAAAFLFFGNLQYLIFGSAKTQAWNDEQFLYKQDAERDIGLNKIKLIG